jgi:hypothetical protein
MSERDKRIIVKEIHIYLCNTISRNITVTMKLAIKILCLEFSIFIGFLHMLDIIDKITF